MEAVMEETQKIQASCIDDRIEKAFRLISNPAKMAALIIIDKAGGSIKAEDFAKSLKELLPGHYSSKTTGSRKLYHELFLQEIVDFKDEIWFKRKRRVENPERNEFLLSLPYFALKRAHSLSAPIEQIVGKSGNKDNSKAYTNRIKLLMSFYLADTHPTQAIYNKPRKMKRSEIEKITGMIPNTIKSHDLRLKRYGIIHSKRENLQMRYNVVKPLSAYTPRDVKFKEKLGRLFELQDEMNVNIDGTLYASDFRAAGMDNSAVKRIKDKGFITAERVDENILSITPRADEIIRMIVVPIYRAIITGNTYYPIVHARENMNGQASQLIKDYFLNRENYRI